MSMDRGYCQAAGALVACMVASMTLPGCIPGFPGGPDGTDSADGAAVAGQTAKPADPADGMGDGDASVMGTGGETSEGVTDDDPEDAGGNATDDARAVASRDENLSYSEDKEMVFSNNKILLFAQDGSPSDSVVGALGKYGDVDATNASAGMYVVTVDGHRESDELAELIQGIVRDEPLIEAGSINWTLPDQPGAGRQGTSSGGAPKAAPEKV